MLQKAGERLGQFLQIVRLYQTAVDSRFDHLINSLPQTSNGGSRPLTLPPDTRIPVLHTGWAGQKWWRVASRPRPVAGSGARENELCSAMPCSCGQPLQTRSLRPITNDFER